jgi:Zn-finger nucleic acid-binding protein
MTPTTPTLLCPACRSPLDPRRCAQGIAHACRRCGGVWLGNVLARALLSGSDALSVAVAEEVARAAEVPFPAPAQGAPCPECGAALVTTLVPRAGVHVDLCAAHGTWFERLELQAVAEAYAALRAAVPAPVHSVATPQESPPLAVWRSGDRDEDLTFKEMVTYTALDVLVDVVGNLLSSSGDDS